MSLLKLWEDSKGQFKNKHVQQIIAFAGDGKLRDGNTSCDEFRSFLSAVPSSLLQRYAENCLNDAFSESGLALQDIINQVGDRLGYEVTFGRYRGATGHIGFDGLWKLPDGHSIVVEVKTTDAYRINLNTIAGYRKSLIKRDLISDTDSSTLIVVGRKDTDDLEAQIRGSKYAWDMRLISVDALIRLMLLKQEVEDPNIIKRISDILIPREFTKLDEIIEILFTTAEDIKEPELEGETETIGNGTKEARFHPVSFHEACIQKIESKLKTTFIKKTRSTYTSSNNTISLVCAVSKEYEKRDGKKFWFAFHPHQKEFLEKSDNSFVAFGCGSSELLILLPSPEFISLLDGLNITEKPERYYWHVHISFVDQELLLHRKQGAEPVNITKYLLK